MYSCVNTGCSCSTRHLISPGAARAFAALRAHVTFEFPGSASGATACSTTSNVQLTLSKAPHPRIALRLCCCIHTQAYYSINSKPVGGATVTFQLRDPKTNTPVGKTYTANTDALGVARVTVDASPVTIVRLVGASTPSSSSPGTVVTGVLDPLSSPSITWVSQQLVIYPTPNARMPSGSTITVVAVYSGESTF